MSVVTEQIAKELEKDPTLGSSILQVLKAVGENPSTLSGVKEALLKLAKDCIPTPFRIVVEKRDFPCLIAAYPSRSGTIFRLSSDKTATLDELLDATLGKKSSSLRSDLKDTQLLEMVPPTLCEVVLLDHSNKPIEGEAATAYADKEEQRILYEHYQMHLADPLQAITVVATICAKYEKNRQLLSPEEALLIEHLQWGVVRVGSITSMHYERGKLRMFNRNQDGYEHGYAIGTFNQNQV